MLPVECVVRGYLAGSGWKDYRATGAVCGHGCPAGLRGGRPAAGADLHAVDEGARPASTTRTSRPTTRASSSAPTRYAEVERIALALYRRAADWAAGARRDPGGHEVRARRRRRRPARARRRGAHAGLVALLAGRRVRARQLAAELRQAVRARLAGDARTGTSARRGRSCRPTSWPARRPAIARPTAS